MWVVRAVLDACVGREGARKEVYSPGRGVMICYDREKGKSRRKRIK
jgi:hypothetical protein